MIRGPLFSQSWFFLLKIHRRFYCSLTIKDSLYVGIQIIFSAKRNEQLLERLKAQTRADSNADANSNGHSPPSSFTSTNSDDSRGRSRYEQLTFRPAQRQRRSSTGSEGDNSENESEMFEMIETIDKNFELIQSEILPNEYLK